MNTKTLLAACFAFLGYFFSGWAVYAGFINHQMIYQDRLKDVILRPEAEFKISYMVVSCLVWAILIVFLFVKMNVKDWQKGALTGAIFGTLASISVGLAVASQFNHGSVHNTMWDAVGSGITSSIAGALAGWWLGRK
ncbi:MAG: hypothetical protein KAX53_04455 [Saprospiraceae bacterium]|jgi:uncharacterized membrane protein|nr:hypothetical protein [Saprospiraceae bacterium]MBP6540401.1 hypothetical protein [Saprospiraceae bacterium]MBP8212972.1 hypothetical protein [Saprospiraceae bacterium]